MWQFIYSHQRDGSLTNKLTVAMSGLAVGAVLIVSGLGLLRERANFHRELEQQAELMLESLSVASSDALYFKQFEEASEVIHNLGNRFQNKQLLVMARLYQTDGRILADAFAEDQHIIRLEPNRFGEKILLNNQLILDWQQGTLVAGKPIWVGDEPVGALSIGLSTSPLQEKLRKTLLEGLLAALIAAISSIVLARFLSRSITKPLQQLTTATKKITAGQWQTITLQTNDELTTLAHAFNHMSAQLHTMVESLERQADELEQSRHIAQSRANELEQALHELHQTQDQLIQQEKMSALGQMVAGIAHEINNPVTFIHGNLKPAQAYITELLSLIDLYQKHYPNPPSEIVEEYLAIDLPFLKKDVVKLLFSMRIGAERIAGIVKSLRTFSRLDESLCKAVDLHDCIESTLVILEHRLKANSTRAAIEINKDYGQLPLVECFAGQLNQVFMNLLTNAIDALDESLTQTTPDSEEVILRHIYIHTAMTSDNHVHIQIGDNAGGISPKEQSRIFDPFYTTKPVGKGTGLGLAISYQIVTELHGGQLTCKSVLGQGTDFFITIPCSQ